MVGFGGEDPRIEMRARRRRGRGRSATVAARPRRARRTACSSPGHFAAGALAHGEPAVQFPQAARQRRQPPGRVPTCWQVGDVACGQRVGGRRGCLTGPRGAAALFTVLAASWSENARRATLRIRRSAATAAVPTACHSASSARRLRRDRRHSERDGRPPPRYVERWRDRGGSQRVGAAAATTAGRGSRSSPPSSSGARSRPSALSPPAPVRRSGVLPQHGPQPVGGSAHPSVGRAIPGEDTGGACWSARPRPGLG